MSLAHLWRRGAFGALITVLLATSLFSSLALPIAHAAGTISGNAFRDFNANGAKDANEVGQAGVVVTAYDAANTVQGTATTDASGNYSFAAGGTGPYRVEFSGWPSYLQPAAIGSSNGSSVQFVPDSGGTVNFGLNYPAEFCQANPDLCTSVFINGSRTSGGPQQALQRFPYTASGTANQSTTIATKDNIGTVWGLAYARGTQTIYGAAFLRRHADLGPGGLGAIYAGNNPTPFVTIPNAGSVGPRDLGAHNATSSDTDAYDKVGKVGLGDLDISDDQATLWTVNLNTKELVSIDIASKALQSFGIPNPGCNGGQVRPFGLKYYQNSVYVGVICDAQSSQNAGDLQAAVYKFTNGVFTSPPVIQFPLNYPKGAPDNNIANCKNNFRGWFPWHDPNSYPPDCYNGSETIYPSPLLSDIEFDTDGSMILGFMDRFAAQAGANNLNPFNSSQIRSNIAGGDILRAAPSGATFVLESNGTVGGRTGKPGSNQGPGGGEFYNDNSVQQNHEEQSFGGLALLPGSNEVSLTSLGPTGAEQGGVTTYSNINGSQVRGYKMYGAPNDGTFSKSNGLGDLELLCDAAPLEIGNRVWRDTNNNGIQDPNEGPIAGVVVQLFQNGNAVGTVTTDANGNYLFNATNVSGGVLPNTNYEIRVDTTQAVLNGGQLTKQDADTTTNGDLRDSDAALNGTTAVVALTTGGPGANNHTFDIGFTQGYSLGNRVWLDANGNGLLDGGEAGIDNVTVSLFADANADGTPDSTTPLNTVTTASGGYYRFDSLLPGTYVVRVDASNFTGAGPLANYISSTPSDPTPNDDKDSDDNGIDNAAPATNGILSGSVTLGPGASEPIGETDLSPSGQGTSDAQANMTVDFGFVQYSLGNRVWFDTNNNGLLDGTEKGIDGVAVSLFADANADGTPDSGTALKTATTASGGYYRFDALPPSSYVVRVDASNFAGAGPLASYTSSTPSDATPNDDKDKDDNGIDNAAPATNGILSGPVTLGPGASEPTGETDLSPTGQGSGDALANMTVDFGFYKLTVGNQLWIDPDNNGTFDAGESGALLAGVRVELYDGTTLVAATTTTASGSYLFDRRTDANGTPTGGGLPSSTNYTVRVPASEFAPGKPLAKLISSTGATGGTDNRDNGIDDPTPATNGISSAVFPLTPGATTGGATVDDATGTTSNPTLDFGFTPIPPLGSIGNYVWHDEDSDGHQDAGEPGIPNVRVVLKDGQGNVVAETRTDSHGGYLFPKLPAGSYCVDVDETTLPAGMTQTVLANPGSDFGNQDQSGNGYCVTITPGEENLTADFGYNNNPTPDVDNPTGSPPAALGDRVWIDTNGNGKQDPNEPSVFGATVTLTTPGPDHIFGTPDDVISGTLTTDDNGTYMFDDLAPGAYKVCVTSSTGASHDILDTSVYTQTGDPDHFGAPASTAAPGTAGDNCTTVPVVLGPGDVFLNADFGYQPTPAAPLGSIGDTVWFDADADTHGPSLAPVDGGAPITQGAPGTADANEYGIPGVTVALIRDTDGDGVYTPGTDPIIATTTTDAKGQYLFPSLPLTSYLVQVDDSASVLTTLTPTYDVDGLTTPNISAAVLTAATPDVRDQDFGYTPQGQTPQLGAIGDTIWFDQDNSGGNQTTQGNEPGIEGVRVDLLNPAGLLIAKTVTDENGHYSFGGLPLNATYQVRINASNFAPGGPLEGMTGTFDPNAPFDNLGPQVTLTAAAPINLDQDFSYYASQPGRIGNLVWLDSNANGVYELASGETPIAGVTMDLYRDLNGNGVLDTNESLLATTTTVDTVNAGTFGSDGTYIFPGLPAGSYIVDVSDRAGVLAGYWHSRGSDGTDNNSQADPYAVTLPAGGEDLTADFGYYVQPAAVGNWVWVDANKDGVQNDGETGINGVPVMLTITYPDATVTTLVTTTGKDPVAGTPGWYSFGNLLQDEDYNGDGNGPEPTFAIAPVSPSGLAITQVDQGGDDTLDSDASGVAALPVKGDTDTLRANDKDPIASYDFGFVRVPAPGAIGNYVWHDEDSDGHQDAGEPGIPNVRVVLKDSQGNVVAETRTDSHGGYLFPNLPAGNYCIDVDETTLPAGMTQTPLTNPGSDFGNQDQSGNGYCVTITPGEENLTADFGYNNNPTPDVDNPKGSPPASLGDRVWIDTNGNGKQDPNEPGVTDATVTLTSPGPDNIFGTPDDVIKGTQTTDSNGMYMFDDLPAGAYKVCVTSSTGASHDVLTAGQYTQTGDPDHFGANKSTAAPGTAGDNCTTVPVVLGPGDVFLNADFGYQPTPAAPLGSIGDTVWFDADADTNGPSLAPVDGGAPVTQGAGGTADANEYGIPGVTVALIRDTNGDGVYTPGTDPIIATTTTDAKGQYLFPSLPLGNYLVLVNDTANVLSGLTPTYDLDGLTTPNISAAVLTTATPNLRTLDFGYTPIGQTPQLGAIGDTVWFDRDGSGGDQTTQGSEPGIEGVVVELLNSTGDLLGTTVTDENGHYYFGGLPLDATYQVRIAASNFAPGGPLEGMAGTFDPDATLDNLGPQVTLTTAAPINLDQDFSYVGTGANGSGPGGRIGNLVWLDSNTNGVYQEAAGETPIGGVTVDLYRDLDGNGLLDPGEPLVGSTTTVDTVNAGSFGSDGTYLFPNLPAGSYIVDVSDHAGVLAGYWHSRGTDATDNNSQADPYAVTLAAGGENLTADFGYYVKPAAVGNWVWNDTNSDGVQSGGEIGINGVPVTLAITYPDKTVTLLVTLTSNDPVAGTPGWYSFGNLLQDEDYNGDGKGPEPTFVISTVDTYNGGGSTASNAGGDDMKDSDPHAGVAAQPVKGDTDTLRSNDADPIASYDFGFVNPTAITLSQFKATWQGGKVKLDWTTTSEIDTFGFHLLRSEDGTRESATRVTTELIPAQGRGQNGASYSWTDTTATAGKTYTYWLEETETDGSTNIYGPAETKNPSIAMNYHVMLPVVVKR